MPVKRSQLRLAALALGVVLLAAVAGFLTAGGARGYSSTMRSSYSTDKWGVKAFYEVLREDENEPRPPARLRSVSELAGMKGVLIVVGPLEEPLRDTEAERILKWVDAGNGLIYFVGAEETSRLPSALDDALGVAATPPPPRLPSGGFRSVREARLLSGFPAFRPAPRMLDTMLAAPRSLVTLKGTPLYWGPRGQAVVWRAFGLGNIIVCATSTAIQNQRIGGSNNLAFLQCAVRAVRPPGGMVIFDEFHHGFARAKRPGDLLSLPGTLAAALQLAVCGLLYLWLQGRRMGPPAGLAGARRPTTQQYLDAAGRLYLHNCRPGDVAAAYGDFARRALARAAGLGPSARPAQIAPLLARGSGLSEDEIQSLLDSAQAAEGSDLSAADAAKLVGQLDALLNSTRGATVHAPRQEMPHA